MPSRYHYPLLRYPGGKSKVAPLLSSLFPLEFQEFRDVCAGSAGVLAYVPRDARRWINDMNADVMSVHEFVRDDISAKQAILDMVRPLDSPEKRAAAFSGAKHRLEQGLDPLSYLLVNRLAHKAIVSRRRSKKGADSWLASLDHRYNRDNRHGLKALTASRVDFWAEALQGVRTTTADYTVPLTAPGDDVVCLIDPPYMLGKASGRLYEHDWSRDEHRKLFDLLRDCPHKFLLTINRSPLTLKLYSSDDFRTPFRKKKGFRMRPREYLYTLSGNRHLEKATELIVMNYDE